jgi:PAS domain S-box-containing protein
MTEPDNQIAWLSDARLAVHALSASPVWLWSAEGDRILWANPVAAAIFDAPSPAAAAQIAFDADHPAAQQIARLGGTLPQGDMPRLERLRGFGGSLGGPLICLCSRFALSGNTAAVLVVATESAGTKQTLLLRAQRLLHDFGEAAALFSADGEFVAANDNARRQFGEARDLVALGLDNLAREAAINDRAEGMIAAGPVHLLKLGAGSTFLLLALLPRTVEEPEQTAAPAAAAVEQPAAAEPHAMRFVWQMDASNRFTQGLEDFTRLVGPKTAAVLLIEPWSEAAQTLQLDPKGGIAQALASHHTWSGIVLDWPVDGSDERVPIELSGLPVFDRDREFAGFRGFGICRDIDKSAARVPPAPPPIEATPALSAEERAAFQELARELSERLKQPAPAPIVEPQQAPAIVPAPAPATVGAPEAAPDAGDNRTILDKLPVGILIYHLDALLYANRAFLEWTGYRDLEALREAGGLDSLFIETKEQPSSDVGNSGRPLTIAAVNGAQRPAAGRLFSVPWSGETALMLTLTPPAAEAPAPQAPPPASDDRIASLEAENRELSAILDTATDGVLMLDRIGRVASANRSAQALFGMDIAELSGQLLVDLFAHESKLRVLDYLDRVARGGGVGAPDPGREMIGRVRGGGLVPLTLSIGHLGDGEKLCVVLRDLTAWKRGQEDLINARRQAENASAAKSEFLAKVSHEIRTPLNAIIGFSEVMMEERFGPIGNDRYRQYLKDMQASGAHLISLINDLLDLSKIESGKLELTFVSVDINEVTQQCVAMLQPEANRERVIVRSSLTSGLPPVTADARSVRQIALNLLSNSIKYTGAGGQVIVSTALNDEQEVVLRVRDTGHGMSEEELETALEPFRQVANAAQPGTTGTGLGLPITKALAEANHARFRITSRVDNGTLVEVTFPTNKVPAQ